MVNKTFIMTELENIAKKYTIVKIKSNVSGAILISEMGARILGMFPDANLTNVLWCPERLAEKFQQKSWFLGGERLWLAPERDFFYENPRDFENHRVPASLDPGEYKETAELVYENNFSLLNVLTSVLYDSCHAKREFALIDDPYASGLSYMGVKITDSITIDEPNVDICCWSITQTYVRDAQMCGTALFPVRKNAQLLGYFGPLPDDRAEVLEGYARFRLDAAKVYKLAIRPEDIIWDNPCKALYVSPYPQADRWFCLIKRSDQMPRNQNECLDPSKADPTGPKGATHSYNNGPTFGENMPFGEIELQLNKSQTIAGKSISSATHELLSYCGSKKEILELAQHAMGIKQIPVLY